MISPKSEAIEKIFSSKSNSGRCSQQEAILSRRANTVFGERKNHFIHSCRRFRNHTATESTSRRIDVRQMRDKTKLMIRMRMSAIIRTSAFIRVRVHDNPSPDNMFMLEESDRTNMQHKDYRKNNLHVILTLYFHC